MRAFQNPIRVRSRFPLTSHHMDPKGPVSSCCTNRSPEPSKRYNRSPSSDEARHEHSSGVTRIGMEREAASRIPHAGATWPDTVDDIFGGDCVVTLDRKSTRLNSSHVSISYAVFCLKK